MSEKFFSSTLPALFPAGVSCSPRLASIAGRIDLFDPVEQLAGFGRWWIDPETAQIILSANTAAFLDVASDSGSIEDCFAHVVPDDVMTLVAKLAPKNSACRGIDHEFRVVNERRGLRWLRMTSLPQAMDEAGIHSGVLWDITPAKHAAMRERFSFESTQFLIGTHALDSALTKVIRLVCENLGWEWGAYWALEQDQSGQRKLGCQYYWHNPSYPLASFTTESRTLRMAPGEGLIGQVWNTGQASWVEDVASDLGFLRRKWAQECGLHAGYAFPVAYVTTDGHRHSPGVLEFFSSLPRQRDAQLPHLSAAIGALIAQTVQRIEQQEHIRRMAQVDDLTGLANRNHFCHLLDAACLDAAESREQFGLLYIDLDRFKLVNDAFGRVAGNAVLREFGQRLRTLVPQDTHIGRVGTDKFAILLNPVPFTAQLSALAEQVLLSMRVPFRFNEHELTLTANVGISVFPENGTACTELLRSANAAMNRSKENSRSALSFVSPRTLQALDVQQSSLVQQLAMETELHRALVNDEFFLEYQPVFDIHGDRILAVESLIRWRRPTGEVVRPDVFIPIAEQSRLIVQIGKWVIKRACADLHLLHQAGFTDVQVNVNMAAQEFINAELPAEMAALIEASGLHARHLCLELTENTVMKYAERVIPVMHALRQQGIKISLDDFGTGYSSLSRLKRLPISSLKIDRSFMKGVPYDRDDCAIVRTTLDLGRHMKLQVIAEGVETDAQMVFLRQFGCPLVQGFLLSRPVALAELIETHAAHQRSRAWRAPECGVQGRE